MNYLKKYRELIIESISEDYKYKYISKIVDEEINKTKSFGLEISEEDIKIEKNHFNIVFNFYWDSIVDCINNSEYAELRQFVTQYIDKSLAALVKKYNELGTTNSTKNMYSCHLDCCISSLMIKINNKLFK